jgi:hypothetical protein
MAITHVHSYLVHPGKGIDESQRTAIRGTTLKLSGKLYTMLDRIYTHAGDDCTTSVSFTTDSQSNEARDLIVSYANRPRADTGVKLAQRLQQFTDGTPGLGLLFLVRGDVKGKIRTFISRFPADVGILAEERKGSLNIEYLEKVFMKNSKKYKAAYYEDSTVSSKAGYWNGAVVDHQIHYGVVRTVSDYWVKDFLASDCLTTPALGSSRLAKMFDKAIKNTSDTTVKDQLASAAKLIPNLDGKKVSADLVAKQYGLSPSAVDGLMKEASSDTIFKEEFVLDRDAFTEILSFESVELNTGAILTAPTGQFNQVFTEQIINKRNGLRVFRAEGVVADQRFRKLKP